MTPDALELFIDLNKFASMSGKEDEMWQTKQKLDLLLSSQNLTTIEDTTHNCFTIGHNGFITWII